jgi:hypothetical protein
MNPFRLHFPLAMAALCASLCAIALAVPPGPASAIPKVEVPPELVASYRSVSDKELRDALNRVSDQTIDAMREVRDQEKALAYALQTTDLHSPEVDAARARIEELRAELAAAEQAYREAALALPEMKERAQKIKAAQATSLALQQERAAIRQAMAERRAERRLHDETQPHE